MPPVYLLSPVRTRVAEPATLKLALTFDEESRFLHRFREASVAAARRILNCAIVNSGREWRQIVLSVGDGHRVTGGYLAAP